MPFIPYKIGELERKTANLTTALKISFFYLADRFNTSALPVYSKH
jgi:hypothetical protein